RSFAAAFAQALSLVCGADNFRRGGGCPEGFGEKRRSPVRGLRRGTGAAASRRGAMERHGNQGGGDAIRTVIRPRPKTARGHWGSAFKSWIFPGRCAAAR